MSDLSTLPDRLGVALTAWLHQGVRRLLLVPWGGGQAARHGIPTIPTIWLPRGTSLVLADLLAERGWSSAVIKPTASTNAYATLFVDAASLATGEAQAHLNTWALEREMMIQPYLDAVREVGEHSLVFIAGEQTHAFRKRAVLCGEADSLGEHPVIPTSQGCFHTRSCRSSATSSTSSPPRRCRS
jgi:hypothetical protein